MLSRVLAALVGLLVFRYLFSLIRLRIKISKARKQGCRPAPTYASPFWDPLSFGQLNRARRADKAKKFPEMLQMRYQEISRAQGRDTPTYNFSLLGRKQMFTCDPKNIQAMLATQFHDFSLGSIRRNNFFALLGNGIFTSDGKSWEHSRAMLRPSFARERVSDIELEQRHNDVLLRALNVDASGWTSVVDLQVLFFRLTIDTSTEFLFGESVNSQAAALPGYVNDSQAVALNEETFAAAFDEAQMYLARRARLGKFYFLINNDEFRKDCRLCHNFIDHYVQLALSRTQGEKTNTEKGKYIFLDELAQQTRDPIELRSQLLNILLAGRDTTASLLGWLFFNLARHPDIWAKLREAVEESFGTESNPKDISFVSLKNCQYLQHCLSEALRLFPVVPGNSRQAVKDTTLPRGGGPLGEDPVFVEAGTEVIYSVHVMHRRPALFGADAAEFKPERWSGRRAGWEFLPFNGGPRICIGQQFALTSAGYATARLLRKFDKIDNAEPDLDTKHNLTLTNCPALGVKVRLHEKMA